MAFGFLVGLLINAIFFVVSELLRPKPEFEDAEAIPFQEARIPLVNPQRKQTVIWGRVRITSPHLMDITEYETVAVTKKVKTGMFSKKKVTLGHRYFVGMQLGICKGNDTIRKVFYDDKVLWDRATDPFTDEGDDGLFFDVNKPDFLGGAENGGGIIGRFRFFPGSTTQNRSTYLQGFQTPSPAYRWTSYLLLEKVEVGESPNIDGFSVELERYPNPLGLSGAVNLIGLDLNPLSIVAECLLDNDFGFTLPISEIAVANLTAAATTLDTEGNGMSLKWTNNQTLERIIENAGKQADGILRFNPKIGQWEFKLVRDDFTVGDLLVLDETNIVDLPSYSRAEWSETVNEVQVNWIDRNTTENPTPASAQDISNFRRQGRHRVLSLTFPGLYDPTVANNIASRELRASAFTFSSISINTNREAWNLLPGDPFVFAWAELGITQLVMRVGSMGFGDAEQTEIQLTGIEDVFKLAENIFTDPPDSLYDLLAGPPQAIAQQVIADQPYFFNLNDPEASTPGAVHSTINLAASPQSNALNYRIWSRQAADPYVGENLADYSPSGTLQAALPENSADTVTSVVVESVSLSGALSTAAVTANEIKQQGVNLAYIVHPTEENEWIAFESLTVVGSEVTMNNVHRGMLDSLPQGHLLGARVWFVNNLGLEGAGASTSEYGPTDVVNIKHTNLATSGETTVGAATQLAFTFRNRVNRPYPGGNFQVEGVRYPSGLLLANSDIEFSWRGRDRTVPDLRYQDDATEELESGFEYKLLIYDDLGSTLLRTVRPSGSGNTPAGDDTLTTANTYDYTLAKQQADGGPFPQYRVELRVEESVTGAPVLVNLLDVIRVFNVDIPLDELERGVLHDIIDSDSPSLYYPMQDLSGNFLNVGSLGSADLIPTGDVGRLVPGPLGDSSKAIHLKGAHTNYVSIADNAAIDLDLAHCIMFFFRCGENDGVNNTPIFYRGSTVTTDMDGDFLYKMFINTSGKIQFEWDPGAFPLSIGAWTSAWRVDDGKWHHIVVGLGGNPLVLMVDGAVVGVSAGGGSVAASGTQPLIFGNGPDTTLSNPPMEFAHIALWDNTGEAVSSSSPVNRDIFGGIWQQYAVQRSPFLRGVVASQPIFHLEPGQRMNTSTSTEALLDLMTNLAANTWTIVESPELQGTVTAGTQLKKAGPYIGQDSHAIDLSTDSLRIDLATLSAATTDGLLGSVMTLTSGDCSFGMWVKLPPGGIAARAVGISFVSSDAGAQRRYQINIEADEKVEVWASSNASSGSRTNGYFEKTDNAMPLDEWVWVVATKLTDPLDADNERFKIYFNGVLQASTATYAGSYAGPNRAVWLDDNPATALVTALLGPTYAPGGAEATYLEAEVGGLTYWTRQLPAQEVNALYALAVDPEFSIRETMLRDNPEHYIGFDDNAAVDEITGIGSPVATGTFISGVGQLPIEADTQPGFIRPLGFRGGERLRYTTPVLQSIEDGNEDINDYATLYALRPVQVTSVQVLHGNTPALEGSSDTNGISSIGATGLLRYPDKSPPAGSTLDATNALGLLRAMAAGTFEKTAGGDVRELYVNGELEANDAINENYTGGAIAWFLVGDRGSGITLPATLDYGYWGAYARAVDKRVLRRFAMRFLGLSRYEIAVLQHDIPGLFMMGQEMQGHRPKTNFYTSKFPPDRDLAPSANKSDWVAGPPGTTMMGANAFIKASSENASSINEATTSFPIVMGGWFRVDLASEDAFVSLSDSSTTGEYLNVGIFGDAAGASIKGTERTSGAVTQGTWAHVVVVWVAANDKRIYLNGELQTTDTNNDAVPAMVNTQSVNAIVESSGLTYGQGSYAGIFLGNVNLDDVAVMEIYSESKPNQMRGLAKRDSAVMHYGLDEYIDGQLAFHDAIDRTKIAVGTGLTPGVIGIIPERKSLCVNLDGTNDIDLARTDYPTGSTERVFDIWLEAGYTGTVFSMGANTDANALVVSVDGSGDVSIHLRGAGNERIWTTALDAGTEHHLLIQLPNAGDSLHDFEVWIDGVQETTIGTAGTDTTLVTTATLNLTLGSDVTDIAKADGTGKMQSFSAYNVEMTPLQITARHAAGTGA